MIRNKAQVLDYLLNKLKEGSSGVRDAALVSTDGLILVSTSEEVSFEERISGIASSILKQAEKTSTKLELGETNFVVISGRSGNLYLKAIDEKSFLAVLVNLNADWRSIQKMIRQTAIDIRHVGEIRDSLKQ